MGNLANVKVNDVHCSPRVHKSSCFIIEDKQVGQGWFSFCKSMLIVLNYLLLHAATNVFQKDLLHDFPRDRRKADRLMILWLLWTILKMGATFAFLQAPVTCPNFLDFSETMVISLARTFTTIGCTPSGIMDLHGTSCLKESLTHCSSTADSSLPWTLLLKTEARESLVKTEANKALSILVLSVTKSSIPSSNRTHFPWSALY